METTFKRDEIRQHAIEGIDGLMGSNPEASELHHEIFNTNYYLIGTHAAKKWLGDNVFDAIETIKEYEKDNFGEVNTDFSDAEKVVNMYVYIVGEEVLAESKTLGKLWDTKLSDKNLKAIVRELKTKAKGIL